MSTPSKSIRARSAAFCAGVIGACSMLTLGLPACGSSAKVDAKSTTVGQELQDLETARNKGLLTEDEYNKQRAQILNRK